MLNIFTRKNGSWKRWNEVLHGKTEYVIRIGRLKQTLSHGLILKSFNRVIRLNQNAGLKSYIEMNTNLRKKAKSDFVMEKFNFMNNAVFGKTMANVRKHREIKFVTTERRRNLVAEPNYQTTKIFTEYLLAIEMEKKPTKNRDTYE